MTPFFVDYTIKMNKCPYYNNRFLAKNYDVRYTYTVDVSNHMNYMENIL